MTNKQKMTDETNPSLLFSYTSTELLSRIAKGDIDAKQLAHRQLANRGKSTNGYFIGFTEAKAEASEAIMNLRPSLKEMDAARRILENGILYGAFERMLPVAEQHQLLELLAKWSNGYDSWKKAITNKLQEQIDEL